MSQSTLANDVPSPPTTAGDSLTQGISLLLLLTVGQRLIGFGRNLLICRWLVPEELGRWNLAFSLLTLAAPLVVLGLPGSLGRYVEHYRQRDLLRPFLLRTTVLTLALATIGMALLCWFGRQAAWFFFGDPEQIGLLLLTCASLVTVIGFNFMVELFTALRRVRVVSYLQLINGLLFCLFALGLAGAWKADAAAIVIGYALACLISFGAGWTALRAVWHNLPKPSANASRSAQILGKVLPFAIWIWFSDLVGNLFLAADRYMIVHYADSSPEVAAGIVGQYHSSLVSPMLILSVATMLSSVIVPYLASDWERGRRTAVADRLNLALKLFGLAAVAASTVVLIMSSWIFDGALGGKYRDGLSVLPGTLMFSIWFGLATMSNSYLLTAERAGIATLGPLAGLFVNVVLNFLLLPIWGLPGAVTATAAANATMLSLNFYFGRKCGMRLELGTVLVALLPLCLLLGPKPAVISVILFAWLAARSTLVFSREGLQLLQEQFEERASAWLSHVSRRHAQPRSLP